MYRAIPKQNKLCHKREKELNDELLRKKLNSIKKTLDNDHVKIPKIKKPSRTTLGELKVDKDNKILLNKITNIMQRTQNTFNQFRKQPARVVNTSNGDLK